MRRTTRRRLLRAGGAAGATGLSAGAGCLGILSGGGDGGTTAAGDGDGGDGDGDGDMGGDGGTGGDGKTTTPGPDPTFRRWLPTPGELEGDRRYDYVYNDLAGFREHADALPGATIEEVRGIADGLSSPLGLAVEEVDAVLQVGFGGVGVVTGSFDRESVAGTLSGRGYSRTGGYGEFDLYAGGEEPPVVALGASSALLCPGVGDNEPVAVARLLVDVARGKARRYHQADEAFDLVSREVTGATRAGANMVPEVTGSNPEGGEFRGMVGLGVGFTVGAGTTDLLMVLAFGNESMARGDPVRTWTEEGLSGLAQYEEYAVEERGRTVRITGTVATDRLDFLSEGDPG